MPGFGFTNKSDRRAFFRANSKKNVHSTLLDDLTAAAKKSFLEGDDIYDEFPDGVCDWDLLPKVVDPGEFLPDERRERKRAQLDYMQRAFAKLLANIQNLEGHDPNRQLVAVDFCSGGGHLGLLLAAFFPDVKVICLERNPRNCVTIVQRIQEAGLDNVEVRNADVKNAEEMEHFDIGVAIHACGWMTDFVQAVCLKRKASYVLCSCCVGKLSSPGPPEECKEDVQHPRSQQFKDHFTKEQFLDMCKKADIDFYFNPDNLKSTSQSTLHIPFLMSGPSNSSVVHALPSKRASASACIPAGPSTSSMAPHGLPRGTVSARVLPTGTSTSSVGFTMSRSISKSSNVSSTPDEEKKAAKEEQEKINRRFCKTAVEVDRNAWAKEHGYTTFLLAMPSWATPKNDIIVGFPSDPSN